MKPTKINRQYRRAKERQYRNSGQFARLEALETARKRTLIVGLVTATVLVLGFALWVWVTT